MKWHAAWQSDAVCLPASYKFGTQVFNSSAVQTRDEPKNTHWEIHLGGDQPKPIMLSDYESESEHDYASEFTYNAGVTRKRIKIDDDEDEVETKMEDRSTDPFPVSRAGEYKPVDAVQSKSLKQCRSIIRRFMSLRVRFALYFFGFLTECRIRLHSENQWILLHWEFRTILILLSIQWT